MDRRNFITTTARGTAVMLAALPAAKLLGQAQKELPVDCSPPKHGNPTPIKFDTSQPIQPRKSVWDLTPSELKRLQAAYQALRDLAAKDPTDPRGWMQQANVHCFNCSGGYDPSNVEIHASWWFLPWHRCYLHVHERILANLIGDPTFRLAYWDWDTYPTHAVLPPPFVPPGTSLYDAYRGATATDVIPSFITGTAAINRVLSTRSSLGFMGAPPALGRPGALENSPHGPVHIWTGYPGAAHSSNEPVGCYYPDTAGGQPVDQSANGCLDMGVLATAAQDPIFFAHHGNIDRLWDVWLQTPGSAGNFTDPKWLNHKFTFYDENKNWISISVADVIGANEQKNLRYQYQPPGTGTTTTTALAAASPARVSRRRMTSSVRSLPPLVFRTAPADKPIALGTKPHVVSVAMPDAHQTNLERFAVAPAAGRHYVLHIEGLELPPNEGTIVEVHLGHPATTTATPDSASYVGLFSVVASGPSHQHHHTVKRNAAFELRPATAAMISNMDQLSVTLIPRMAGGGEPRRSSLTYRRIYLTTEND